MMLTALYDSRLRRWNWPLSTAQTVGGLIALIWLPLMSYVLLGTALGRAASYILLPGIPAVLALYIMALRRWRESTIAVVGEVPLTRLRHAVAPFPTRSEVWLNVLNELGL